MKVLVLVLGFFSFSAFATVTVANPDCPTQFEGKVKEIIKEVGPEQPLGFQKVIFENHHTLKGDAPSRVLLDVLQNGPFAVESGEDYRVQMKNGKLCWIERL